MLKIYDIPRADKRERCAECLELLYKKDARYPSKKHQGERFSKVCGRCRFK